MDRVWIMTRDDRDTAVGHPSEEFALASRGGALVQVRAAIEARTGPVLLTGEAGVGKTWLWHRLRSEMPGSWRWVSVDLSPANDPAEFYRLIGYGLGLSGADRPDASRLALAEFLQEGAVDGKRWVLVVDEAHSVSAAVLEEVRILANRLGHSDGFGALILVGQTALARRLATRPLAALAARLSARSTCGPSMRTKRHDLLGCLVPGLSWDKATLERHHRDAGGNPRWLIQRAREASAQAPRRRRNLAAAPLTPCANPRTGARPRTGRAAHRARLECPHDRPGQTAAPGRGGADRGRLGATGATRGGRRHHAHSPAGPRGGSGHRGRGGGNDRRPLRRAPGLGRVVQEPGAWARGRDARCRRQDRCRTDRPGRRRGP